jgi:hypothetical protein
MKFHIEDINEYTGSDLIFLIGTPGSKWSAVHRLLCESSHVNTTDWSEEKSWGDDVYGLDIHGKINNLGVHKGAYWGPGNIYGKKFERLDSISKNEMISEFMDAFETWDKVKIIKSHWFAYNIPYLHHLFPKAKIVFCYGGDLESFYWWHKCGSWGMSYANYSWYKDDVRMLEKIKEENSNILKFCIDRDLDIKHMSKSWLYDRLNLPDFSGEDHKTVCKVAVYSGEYVSNFSYLEQIKKIKK